MAEATATAYEEQRRRQVEANKRKLEELQLHRLSAAVREAAAAAKAATVKKRKTRVPLDAADAVKEPPRRSGRLANLLDKPVYNEAENIKRTYVRDPNQVDATDEERSYAISKAEDLAQELGSSSSFPLFIKPMTHYRINRVQIPIHFSRKYLPEHDDMITMVDEDDNRSVAVYLAMKNCLSIGWRGFCIQHKLADGDCLVFQLIERTEFKVYIIRASSYYGNED